MIEYDENIDPVEQSKKVGRAFAQAHHEAERQGIKSFLFKSASVDEFDQRILMKDVASSLDEISEKYLNEVSDGRAKIARSIRKEYIQKESFEGQRDETCGHCGIKYTMGRGIIKAPSKFCDHCTEDAKAADAIVSGTHNLDTYQIKQFEPKLQPTMRYQKGERSGQSEDGEKLVRPALELHTLIKQLPRIPVINPALGVESGGTTMASAKEAGPRWDLVKDLAGEAADVIKTTLNPRYEHVPFADIKSDLQGIKQDYVTNKKNTDLMSTRHEELVQHLSTEDHPWAGGERPSTKELRKKTYDDLLRLHADQGDAFKDSTTKHNPLAYGMSHADYEASLGKSGSVPNPYQQGTKKEREDARASSWQDRLVGNISEAERQERKKRGLPESPSNLFDSHQMTNFKKELSSYKEIKYANKYIQKRGDQWVIIQKGTGKVLSHHDSESKAESAFRAMMQSKHGAGRPFHIEGMPDVGEVREDGAIWDDLTRDWHTCNPTGEEYDRCTRWHKGHMGPQLKLEPGDIIHSNYAPYDTENPDPHWDKGVVLDRRPDVGDHPGDNWYYAQFPHGIGNVNSVRIHKVIKPTSGAETDVDDMKKKMWGWEASVKVADDVDIDDVDVAPKRGVCTCYQNPMTCQVHNPDVVPEVIPDPEGAELQRTNPVSVKPDYEHPYLGLVHGSIETQEDLEEYWKKQADLVGPSAKNSPGPGISQTVPNSPTTDSIVDSNAAGAANFTEQNSTALCPHCGIPMTDSGGVDTCTQCGYTQQDWIDAENPIIRQYANTKEAEVTEEKYWKPGHSCPRCATDSEGKLLTTYTPETLPKEILEHIGGPQNVIEIEHPGGSKAYPTYEANPHEIDILHRCDCGYCDGTHRTLFGPRNTDGSGPFDVYQN